jgi:hypothetical protein
MSKPAHSRLGDVLLPLAQIIAKVAPDRLDGFLALAKSIEAERRQGRSLTWEASVMEAVVARRQKVHRGLLLIEIIAARVNASRSKKEELSNRMISEVLTSLGLKTRKAGGNRAALVWDEAAIDRLARYYVPPESAEVEEEEDDDEDAEELESI